MGDIKEFRESKFYKEASGYRWVANLVDDLDQENQRLNKCLLTIRMLCIGVAENPLAEVIEREIKDLNNE